MKLRNMYVLVQDTDRAIKFYTEALDFELYRREDRYTILKIDDVYFGLLNEKYEPNTIRGNNCVPVFKVENALEWFDRLQRLNVRLTTELQDLPGVKYFQFLDSESNTLEIYQEVVL